MKIASLLTDSILAISQQPLTHEQGKLLPIHECIAGYDQIEDRIENAYGIKKIIPIKWKNRMYCFVVDLMQPDFKVKFIEEFRSALKENQFFIDTEIKELSGDSCMLNFISKKCKLGLGNYDSESGGAGSLTDPRTGNKFEVLARLKGSVAEIEIWINYALLQLENN